jgi:hypothetical protein
LKGCCQSKNLGGRSGVEMGTEASGIDPSLSFRMTMEAEM